MVVDVVTKLKVQFSVAVRGRDFVLGGRRRRGARLR
jgi:hypothetical protein